MSKAVTTWNGKILEPLVSISTNKYSSVQNSEKEKEKEQVAL